LVHLVHIWFTFSQVTAFQVYPVIPAVGLPSTYDESQVKWHSQRLILLYLIAAFLITCVRCIETDLMNKLSSRSHISFDILTSILKIWHRPLSIWNDHGGVTHY